MSLVRKKLGNSNGQILIFVTLAFVLLGLFVGLAIDAGRAYLLQARLSKLVDAAALAAARAIVGAPDPVAAAESAACDSAAVNGMDRDNCPSANTITVAVQDVLNPDESPQQGVVVGATQTMNTAFMRLGTLIGCTTCETILVTAAGSAAPGIADIVLVMDDTKSMRDGPPVCNFDQTGPPGCPIKQAREGAEAFVDSLINPGYDLITIALAPFRGCYNESGLNQCVDNSSVPPTEIIPLTNVGTTIIGTRGERPLPQESPDTGTGIRGLWAQGGSNTNVCIGLDQGQAMLSGSGSRSNARKILVILTDAENTRTDPPGFPECSGANTNAVDSQTFAKATAIKSSGVMIYVIGYGVNGFPNDNLCNPSAISGGNDRNLAKCIASSTPGTNDRYFEALTPDQIPLSFAEIAEDIKRRLRLVN